MLTLYILVGLTIFVTSNRLTGQQLWSVTLNNQLDLSPFEDVLTNLKIKLYSDVALHRELYVIVPTLYVGDFQHKMESMKLKHELMSENIHRSILEQRKRRSIKTTAFDKTEYNRYEDIMSELENLRAKCNSTAGVNCEIYTAGKSFENRDLRVLKMSLAGRNRPAIWLESLTHAREWLSGATLMGILDRMVSGYGSDAVVTRMLNDYDWYFLPVVNPDGYVYSWNGDFLARFWRKSRANTTNAACPGIDLNRNYDAEWRRSTQPCSDVYSGVAPASEPETQTVQRELLRLSGSLRAVVSLHTAAQMILLPYGYEDELGDCVDPPDAAELLTVGNAFADAIQNTYDTEWERGNSCEILYAAAGTTKDFAKMKANVKFTTIPELRGPGFDPPASAIPLSTNEVFNGLAAMGESLKTIS